MNNHKIFDNDKGVSTAIAGIIVIVIYLFLVSFFISFFAVNIYGYDALSTNSITLPKADTIQVFSNEQNYTSGTNDKGLLHTDYASGWEYIEDVGLMLTRSSSFTEPISLVFIDYLQSTDGYYTNEYVINNSVKGDYVIVLNHASSIRILPSGANLLYVQNDGFCINYDLLGCKFFYPYANANQYEDVVIKTVYYDKEPRSVEFYFNGDYLFKTENLYAWSIFSSMSKVNYAGVGSNTIGFVLKEYHTSNPVVKDESGFNILTSLINVIVVLVKMSVWSLPVWILPIELQALMISLPEAVLVICIAVVIRGN